MIGDNNARDTSSLIDEEIKRRFHGVQLFTSRYDIILFPRSCDKETPYLARCKIDTKTDPLLRAGDDKHAVGLIRAVLWLLKFGAFYF